MARTLKTAATASGDIAYEDCGAGPVALFIHGFPLNGFHWRHQLAELHEERRCIAPDLLGLGESVPAGSDLSFTAQARMIGEFLDCLGIAQVDLVGNDSGSAIAQLVAVSAPERIRTLTLTNGDAHDNWPPQAFMASLELAKAGRLGELLGASLAQSKATGGLGGLEVAYQFPERITPAILDAYLGPITGTAERQTLVDAYVRAFDPQQTLAIEGQLREFTRPTMIVWGDDDVFFPVRWASWLAESIPGVRQVVELAGGRLFFPEERSSEFNALLRAHWFAYDE